MPTPREVLNGFVAKEVAGISGLSLHMINYLAREGYLIPAYSGPRARGRVRYYSYKDLVIARMIRGLMEAGIEIKRLKIALGKLKESDVWKSAGARNSVSLVVTNGSDIFLPNSGGSLMSLTKNGQLSFTFVMDVGSAAKGIKAKLSRTQRDRFNLIDTELEFAPRQANLGRRSRRV